jgi:hypothetical protein
VSDVLYRLAALPGGEKALPEKDEPLSVEELMAMVPGMMNGTYYTMTVLVQNRTPKNTPMGSFHTTPPEWAHVCAVVVVAKAIAAVASPKGTPIFLEGKERGEPSIMFEYPHLCVSASF